MNVSRFGQGVSSPESFGSDRLFFNSQLKKSSISQLRQVRILTRPVNLQFT